MGLPRSGIPWITFAMGIVGCSFGFGYQYLTHAIDWPLNFAGKAYNAWPAFIPAAYTPLADTFSVSPALNAFESDLCLSLSAEDIFKEEVLSVYPNPFHGILDIRFRRPDKFDLSIYSLSGEKIYCEKISGDQKIDLSKVPAGVYLLSMMNDLKIINIKIVKL